MDDNLFTTTFAAQITALQPSEDDLIEAKASLTSLKDLVPADLNPDDDPDLLYIVANLAVAGQVNLNDDGLDIPTALAVYKKFEKKQVNIEHNRHQCVGYILKAGLSEYGTDRIITEDEARLANKPFNITTMAVLWRVVSKELCDYIVEASNPLHPDFKSLSLSFEMGFKDFSIASLPMSSKEIAAAYKIVGPDDSEFEKYKSALRSYKGDGLSPDNPNQRVYRIMPDSVIPLGQGIVSTPAAAVKGIMAVENKEPTVSISNDGAEAKQKEDIKTDYKLAIEAAVSSIESIDRLCSASIIYTKNSVSPNTNNVIISSNMNKPELSKLKEQALSAQKPEEFQVVFASVSSFAETLMAESERLTKESEEQKNAAKLAEQNKAEALAALDKITKEFEQIKAELEAIKNEQVAAEADRAFQSRMASLDEVFDLDDETRAFLVDEVRTCESDEAFAKKMDKFKKIMKEKTKAFKKEEADKAKKKSDEMCAALASKGVTVTVDADTLDFKEIIASAAANETSTPVANTVETRASLKDLAKAAFADVTIGGKKVSETSKKE